MKTGCKYVWFTVNIILAIAFLAFFLFYSHACFISPDGGLNILFVVLLVIMLDGLVESFILCNYADEDSWSCWVSLFLLTVAIISLFIQFYLSTQPKLDEISEIGANIEHEVDVIVLIIETIALGVHLMISPILITKYSSWFLLLISIIGEHASNYELIFPIIVIIINIIANIIFNCVELTFGLLIAYVCVFGALSIASLVITIKKLND